MKTLKSKIVRTIKFRGKNKKTNEWLVGNLMMVDDEAFIFPEDAPHSYNVYRVDADTVGQFTGLLDKNGKEIYEGDIVRSVRYKEFVYKVVYDNRFASFCLARKQDMYKHYFGEAMEAEDCEVIGNIHDNLELLERCKSDGK